jgi:hypothetical protein
MHRSKLHSIFLLAAAALAVCLPLSAATVIQMNLGDMVDRADKIFRGTVLEVREGTVQAGGGELPIVTYRIRVDEAFKGTFEEVKGLQIAEITMLGKLKVTNTSPVRRSADILDLPRLDVGQDYLLLTTASSAIGLSTTVGLGQGRFEVQGKPGQETVVNDNENLGLFNGMDATGFGAGVDSLPEGGPLPYNSVAAVIRNLVGQ